MLSPFVIKLIYLIIPLISSSLGFYNFFYFISVGYGLSISFSSLGLMIILFENLSLIPCIIGITLIIYGLRLSGYLLYRELFYKSYKENIIKNYDKKNKTMKAKIIIWTSCAILYSLMVSPFYFILVNNKGVGKYTKIGGLILILGLILEIMADNQKSKAKLVQPNRFVDTGLYKIVRCPNYLGEVIFWTGLFISGIGNYDGVVDLGVALVGLGGIVFVMFSGARRIEIRQNKNYGDLAEYRKYVKEVPILIPLVPLYSVEKYTWLVA